MPIEPPSAPSAEPGLRVVFADDVIAVVDKPSGLLSCPGRDPSLWDSVQTRVPRVFPGATGSILAHRLDQPTSGLMVVALTPAAHRALRLQFEARTVHKQYEAVLVGRVAGDDGVVELPFRLDVDHRPHQIYDPVHGKVGVTQWQVIERWDDGDDGNARTRVAFEPLTGRTHQLRVHSAHPLGLGCPIAGDNLYGDPTSAPRLLLHARQLSFTHPVSGEPLTFQVAPPLVFQRGVTT
jgi:tRNA pseudouridine32 synthase/23S rRNA pseudouridine746 synthase